MMKTWRRSWGGSRQAGGTEQELDADNRKSLWAAPTALPSSRLHGAAAAAWGEAPQTPRPHAAFPLRALAPPPHRPASALPPRCRPAPTCGRLRRRTRSGRYQTAKRRAAVRGAARARARRPPPVAAGAAQRRRPGASPAEGLALGLRRPNAPPLPSPPAALRRARPHPRRLLAAAAPARRCVGMMGWCVGGLGAQLGAWSKPCLLSLVVLLLPPAIAPAGGGGGGAAAAAAAAAAVITSTLPLLPHVLAGAAPPAG